MSLAREVAASFSAPGDLEQHASKTSQVLTDLAASLDSKVVKICVHHSTPSFSDGHTLTAVKINGQIKALFEIGNPD